MGNSEILEKGAAHSTTAMGAGVGAVALWIALGLAALFVGYLLLDSFLVWRRAQRLRELAERSRRQVAEQEAEARASSREE